MQSKAIKQAKWELEQFTQGLISQEEYDRLRGYEKYKIEEDPQWKKFFERLPTIVEKFWTKQK